MYSTNHVFGSTLGLSGLQEGSITVLYVASAIAFAVLAFFVGLNDEKFVRLARSRSVMLGAAVLTCVATLIALIPADTVAMGLAVSCVSGVLTGIGSAVLMMLWGVAFARESSSTIAVSGSIAIALGFVLSKLFIQAIPLPFGGVVAAAIPFVEFFILRSITPQPLAPGERSMSFNMLPTSKLRMGLTLFVPTVFICAALGILKCLSVQTTMEGPITPEAFMMLMMAGLLTISLFVLCALLIKQESQWNPFLRTAVPVIACVSLLVSLFVSANPTFSDLYLLVTYILVEALVWVYYSIVSHRFRLSPLFVFGMSRGLVVLSILAGVVAPHFLTPWLSQMGVGETGLIVVALVLIILGCARLPRESDLEQRIVQCPAVRMVSLELDSNLNVLGQPTKPADVPSETAGQGGSVLASDSNGSDKDADGETGEQDARRPGIAENPAEDESAVSNSPSEQKASGASPSERIASPSSNESAVSEARAAMVSKKDVPETAKQSSGKFSRKVRKVAKTYLLTERETDILFELAKGNNPAYIQEKYFISAGTVKTHIRNIYHKLDVHKRNELLRLIEEFEDYE